MATFKVVADNRYKRKDNTNRYCLRVTVDGTVRYLPLQFQLTPEQHTLVFSKKAMGAECINFREKIREIEIKAERIYSSMRRYDAERFKQLFYDQGKISEDQDSSLPITLSVTELFQYYADNTQIKEGTKIHMKVTQSMLNTFHSNVYIDDIDVKFLKRFEVNQLGQGKSISTVASYMRDIRTVTNYFRQVKKILPTDYEYPFGKGGYSIMSVRKMKNVLRADEIMAVITQKKFECPKQEYARNIWLCLYNANGINVIDLLRLRWENVEYNHIHLIRKKTETTRKSNIQELVIPLTPELKHYLNLVGDPTSPFVLGKIKEGYTDKTLRNRKNRFRQEINPELKSISTSMKLTVPLIMASARDCYASTLNRNGVPREFISNMLGHNDPRTTSHYLDSLSIDDTFKVNDFLVKGKREANDEEAAAVA
jgi:integrase